MAVKKYLADRTTLIDASGIRKIFNLAASMKDPVNFSIGQPDFDVPEPLKQIAIDAIKHGKNKYTQNSHHRPASARNNPIFLKRLHHARYSGK